MTHYTCIRVLNVFVCICLSHVCAHVCTIECVLVHTGGVSEVCSP